MSKKIIFLLVLLIYNLLSSAQKSNEYYFRFPFSQSKQTRELIQYVSVSNIDSAWVYAYANDSEFEAVKKSGLKYEQLVKQNQKAKVINMATSIAEFKNWDRYPVYELYEELMNRFSSNYPTLCQLISPAKTVKNHRLTFAKITSNKSTAKAKPRFMYFSSMHGDEVAGYVLMLRLIDYMLSNYGKDAQITRLVDNLEIYICPLSNPDGTFEGGNFTVSNANRYNANEYDLNRNFPDPDAGINPAGEWQRETITLMDFGKKHQITLAANLHGGVEALLYPWDTWLKPHPDEAWFQLICHRYADTVRKINPTSFTMFNRGVINGGAWYLVKGSHRDYANYFLQSREVTIEISKDHIVDSNNLPSLWNWNKKSLINFMEEALYGIHGYVTDFAGNPLSAKITVLNHDADNSYVLSTPENGDYHRLIAAGSYTLVFSADNYISDTVKSVVVNDRKATNLDIQLKKLDAIVKPSTFKMSDLSFYPIPANDYMVLSFKKSIPEQYSIEIYSIMGIPILKIDELYKLNDSTSVIFFPDLQSGTYILQLNTPSEKVAKLFIKN